MLIYLPTWIIWFKKRVYVTYKKVWEIYFWPSFCDSIHCQGSSGIVGGGILCIPHTNWDAWSCWGLTESMSPPSPVWETKTMADSIGGSCHQWWSWGRNDCCPIHTCSIKFTPHRAIHVSHSCSVRFPFCSKYRLYHIFAYPDILSSRFSSNIFIFSVCTALLASSSVSMYPYSHMNLPDCSSHPQRPCIR